MTSKLAKFDALVDQALKRLIGLKNALPPTTDADLAELGAQYGLVVITDASNADHTVTFEPSTPAQQRACCRLLKEELALYDPEVVRLSQLQRLIICTNLMADGDRANGLAQVGRFVVDTLIIDADHIEAHWEQSCATLHHELFHAIDYRDDAQHYIDPEWRKLNGENYRYNDALQFNAGEYYSDAVYFPRFDFRHLQDVPEGFLNQYATQSVHEDKAVVYSWMIVRYNDLQEICRQDEIVRAKVEYMKALLAKFHRSFDESFWQRVAMRGGGSDS
jgi:hypothetical protein